MSDKSLVFAFATVLLLVGCSTVERARKTQRDLHGRYEGEPVACATSACCGETLGEMVSFAISNRPSMVSARLAVEDARLALKEIAANAPLASSTPWNSIDANLNGGYSASSPHSNHLKAKTDGDWSASLSLDILIYDFGRNDANIRAQSESVVAAELAVVDAGYSVFEEVSSAYFERIQSAALLEVALTNVQMRTEHLELAEARLAEGEAQKLDVTRAMLDLAEAKEIVVSASNDLITANANLASAIGLEASLGEDLPACREKFFRAFSPTSESSAELFEFARTNAPSMRVVRARLAAASAAVDYAIANLKPSISASLSLNWVDPLWYWHWGVSAAQSIFTGFKKTTAVDRARVALESAASDVDAAELELSLSIERAVAERDNAREAFESAQASVASALDNLETVSGQLAVGDVSRIDYTDAVASYVTALANSEKAFCRGQIAEAKLFALIGIEPTYGDGGSEQ
jgi:outer membrane protein